MTNDRNVTKLSFYQYFDQFIFLKIFSSSDVLLHYYYFPQEFSKSNSPHKKSYPQNSIFVIFAMFTSFPMFFEHVPFPFQNHIYNH